MPPVLFSSPPSPADIQRAIQGLRHAVNHLLARLEQRKNQKPSSNSCISSLQARIKRINHILKHMHHCLWQLSLKRESLQVGFNVLCEQVWPDLLQRLKNLSKDNSKKLHQVVTSYLQHFFIQLLRLHDGLILVISGECRHPGDLAQARQNHAKFSSHLAAGQPTSNLSSPQQEHVFRSDGYTQLYSPDCTYSGYGWDEFMDDTNGLQQRLSQELLPIVPCKLQDTRVLWEWLLEKAGGELLESVLDRIEGQIRSVDFKAFAHQFKHDLTTVLQHHAGAARVTVELSLADKLESLKVTMGSTFSCQLSRFASEFSLPHPEGVLPVLTASEWWHVLKLPKDQEDSTQRAKRRVIIQESSDDDDEEEQDDDDNNNNNQRDEDQTSGVNEAPKKKSKVETNGPIKQTSNKKVVQVESSNQCSSKTINKENQKQVDLSSSSGIVVKVQEVSRAPTANVTEDDKLVSLNDIKLQMGASEQELAASREVVEAEEAGCERDAAAIDDAPVDLTGQDYLTMEEAQRKVKRFKRVLKKALTKRTMDDDEVWNSREQLREALIQAGNSCLWGDTSVDAEERREALEHAVQYFSEAQELVHDQEMLLNRTALSLTSEEVALFRRNLKLLLGRACTNSGIAKIELSRLHDVRDSERKILLKDSIKDLDAAVSLTEAIEELAPIDKSDTSKDVKADWIRSRELRALSMRWKGSAYWMQGRYVESTSCFDQAASVIDDVDTFKQMVDESIFDATLKALIESYFASSILADTALNYVNSATINSIRNNAEKYDEMVCTTCHALEKTASTSALLQDYVSHFLGSEEVCDAVLEFNGIATSKSVREILHEANQWWNQRKAAALQKIVPKPHNVRPALPRTDIMGDGSCNAAEPPTARLIVDGERRRGKKRKQFGAGFSNIGVSNNTTLESESYINDFSSRRRYRKWGDELLPQTVDSQGRYVPQLTYPSIAPEMPAAIKAIFDARGC